MRALSCLALFALAACQSAQPVGIRTVEIPVASPVACVTPEQIPAEPETIRERLTGEAVSDALLLAESALELRRYGGELRALLAGCVG